MPLLESFSDGRDCVDNCLTQISERKTSSNMHSAPGGPERCETLKVISSFCCCEIHMWYFVCVSIPVQYIYTYHISVYEGHRLKTNVCSDIFGAEVC